GGIKLCSSPAGQCRRPGFLTSPPLAPLRSMPMRCVQVLSGLALKRLLASAPQPVSAGARAAVDFLTNETRRHVTRALRQANARAWLAIEILLAGEELWERAEITWERSLQDEFFQPIRNFLDSVSLGPFGGPPLGGTPLGGTRVGGSDASQTAWPALEAALQTGLLTSGALDLSEPPPRHDENGADAEGSALHRLADQLERAGSAELGRFFQLRCDSGEPLLVVLVAAFLRQAVEADPDLFGDLTEACALPSTCAAIEDFRDLTIAVQRHQSRLNALLGSLRRSE